MVGLLGGGWSVCMCVLMVIMMDVKNKMGLLLVNWSGNSAWDRKLRIQEEDKYSRFKGQGRKRGGAINKDRIPERWNNYVNKDIHLRRDHAWVFKVCPCTAHVELPLTSPITDYRCSQEHFSSNMKEGRSLLLTNNVEENKNKKIINREESQNEFP